MALFQSKFERSKKSPNLIHIHSYDLLIVHQFKKLKQFKSLSNHMSVILKNTAVTTFYYLLQNHLLTLINMNFRA